MCNGSMCNAESGKTGATACRFFPLFSCLQRDSRAYHCVTCLGIGVPNAS